MEMKCVAVVTERQQQQQQQQQQEGMVRKRLDCNKMGRQSKAESFETASITQIAPILQQFRRRTMLNDF